MKVTVTLNNFTASESEEAQKKRKMIETMDSLMVIHKTDFMCEKYESPHGIRRRAIYDSYADVQDEAKVIPLHQVRKLTNAA